MTKTRMFVIALAIALLAMLALVHGLSIGLSSPQQTSQIARPTPTNAEPMLGGRSALILFPSNPAVPDIYHPILEYEASQSDAVSALAFSPDGSILASATIDNSLELWNAKSGKEIRTLSSSAPKPHNHWPDGHRVVSLAFSPDGLLLAAAGDVLKKFLLDGAEVRLWEVNTGKPTRIISIARFAGTFTRSAVFLRKGTILLTATEVQGPDKPWGEILEWDVRTGKLVRPWLPMESGCKSIALSPDERTLAVGFQRGIALWDVATTQLRSKIPSQGGFPSVLCYSPDGRMLVGNFAAPSAIEGSPQGIAMTIESAKTVQFWDEKGNYLGPMMVQQPGYVNAIAFSPDGDRLAIGNESGTIRCYRIR